VCQRDLLPREAVGFYISKWFRKIPEGYAEYPFVPWLQENVEYRAELKIFWAENADLSSMLRGNPHR